ncbi:ATP-binding protein [Alcaligenes sp. Me129]|uniref:ATP-binding protein n=1 Tax=Alcaligenes sp. Me129 TaxID=3392635 RepID=UPI003D216EFE
MNNFIKKAEIWTPTGGGKAFVSGVHTKLIREAASRRGVLIERIDNKTYFLSHENKSVLFVEHLPALTSATCRAASHDKNTTKIFLERAGVKTPMGSVFSPRAMDSALSYAQQIGFPVVIKPIRGSGGKGVISDIQNEEHFKLAWTEAGSTVRCIVEKHIYGRDYRVFVVNGRFVCAALRIPVNITGDGKSTVSELIQQKNKQREDNPYVGEKQIQISGEMLRNLQKLGFNKSSIIPAQMNIQLLPVANIGTGGDSKDVTDEVHPGFAEIAIKAAHSIPGAYFAGVDLLVPDISVSPDEQEYAVCEINTRCDIGLHHFPVFGPARDAAGALIESIFPSAKPIRPITMKKVQLTLQGQVIGVGMRQRIQRIASLYHLKGWVRNEGRKVSALICGSESAVDRAILSLASSPSTYVSSAEWLGTPPNNFEVIQ